MAVTLNLPAAGTDQSRGVRSGADEREGRDAQAGQRPWDEGDGFDRLCGADGARLEHADDFLPVGLPGGDLPAWAWSVMGVVSGVKGSAANGPAAY
jgi:hypothetical protein